MQRIIFNTRIQYCVSWYFFHSCPRNIVRVGGRVTYQEISELTIIYIYFMGYIFGL